jgi:predicted nucleotidyltransferase
VRLSDQQIDAIKSAVRQHFGPQAGVRLFGSRTDDDARGGDIDLYVDSVLDNADDAVAAEVALWADLQRRLGEQRIDILVDYPAKQHRPPIYRVAREQGVCL